MTWTAAQYGLQELAKAAKFLGKAENKLRVKFFLPPIRFKIQSLTGNVSAVAEHAWSAGHGVDWNGVTILDQHKDLHPRLALEAFHIRKQPLPLNRDKGSLPPAYDHLKNS